MAAPVVTGIVALMLEQFTEMGKLAGSEWEPVDLAVNPPLPSTIKAVLINTAKDLEHPTADKRDPLNPDTQEPVLYHKGPDLATGYGLVNALKAVDLIAKAASERLIHEDALYSGEHIYEVDVPCGQLPDQQREVKITLAWDDVEGNPSLDPVTFQLVNDLDLLLIDPWGRRIHPWTVDPMVPGRDAAGCNWEAAGCPPGSRTVDPNRIKPAYRGEDHRNNVEMVQNIGCGTYKLVVSGAGIKNIADGPQRYSLVSNVPLLRKKIGIIPEPGVVEPGWDKFILSNHTLIQNEEAGEGVKNIAAYLHHWILDQHGIVLQLRGMPDTQNFIKLEIDSNLASKLREKLCKENELCEEETLREGYELEVIENKIKITAIAEPGLFYGVQSLLQLLPAGVKDTALEVSEVTVWDKPRFKWRGMHLDVSRHFMPVEFIKKFIDILAMHKMNKFHWHLTDDNGWRLEIKSWPNLTGTGACRVNRESLHWENPERKYPPPYRSEPVDCYYYTQDQVREIVQYAEKRYITVIPEIELPAHSTAALAAYPNLSCTGSYSYPYVIDKKVFNYVGPYFVMPGHYWPNFNALCPGKQYVDTFLKDVLGEVMNLFPSEFIHIGGDELRIGGYDPDHPYIIDEIELQPPDNWNTCPACQKRMEREGLDDEKELFSSFIKQVERILRANDRKLIGWDEIFYTGSKDKLKLAPKSAVMTWRTMELDGEEERSKAAAEKRHPVVRTPDTYCYLDYRQDQEKSLEPVAIPDAAKFSTLDNVYAFDPIPEGLAEEKHKYILGAQGNLWTEYMLNGDHVEYMALPRMSALAEVVWSLKDSRGESDFKTKLKSFYNRLDALDINYRNHITGKAAKGYPTPYDPHYTGQP
jgi:hexosaminidase